MIEKEKIEMIVNKIAEKFKPEKIILFGSYASNTQNIYSDLDICVIVKNSSKMRYNIAREIRKYLWGVTDIPKDIIVFSQKEINEWKDVDNSFISNIIKTGKILYENKK